MAKVVFAGENVWILSFSLSSFSGQQLDPQLIEMKTSLFIIAYPRIETCSKGKWLDYGIFQNKVLSSSYVEKLIISGRDLQVSKEMSAF